MGRRRIHIVLRWIYFEYAQSIRSITSIVQVYTLKIHFLSYIRLRKLYFFFPLLLVICHPTVETHYFWLCWFLDMAWLLFTEVRVSSSLRIFKDFAWLADVRLRSPINTIFSYYLNLSIAPLSHSLVILRCKSTHWSKSLGSVGPLWSVLIILNLFLWLSLGCRILHFWFEGTSPGSHATVWVL